SSGGYGLDNFGINYGRIADNLPSPAAVSQLLQSLNITRVKLYDADPQVLTAFANTDVEFIVTVENAAVAKLTDESYAASWIQQWVQPHLPRTRITSIALGNEVLSSEDTALWDALLPAMRSVHSSLVSLKLDQVISVTTTHAMSVLSDSYPPSAGSFRDEFVAYIKPILEFHSKTKSPFLINAYPYFAYKDADDDDNLLNYVLFEPNPGVLDSNTNLTYDNMLYAQIDAVYYAIELMGHDDIAVKVSETGWPSRGDADERGATPANAAKYNGNLLARVASSEGTPARPEVPVDVRVFALFNEDLKPGPTSERNYGLFYPNMSTVYDDNLGFSCRVACQLSERSTCFFCCCSSCEILEMVVDAESSCCMSSSFSLELRTLAACRQLVLMIMNEAGRLDEH
uniref:glucan endo-1,3-beta-D-glucosidase n=1 Tax=Kalanchoe fedtschenkoi TaxID=63787 RepID=A0A7N0VD40_KALFE